MTDDHKNELREEPAEIEVEAPAQQENTSATDEAEKWKAELADQKDKYLRLFAEFDNYKKRTAKEKIELIRSASQDVVTDLLVILDDFERAMKLAAEQQNEAIFPEGMKLVYQKLIHILHSKGLQAMESNGKEFDPEFHEAITELPAQSEDQKGKVFDTVEKGYLLNEKIIRFAKVVVAK